MPDQFLVIGYGDTGRNTVSSVPNSQPDARLTVPDIDFAAADRIVIAVPDDLDAFLITRAVRPLNPGTLIVALIREPENHALFAFEGAVTVHLRFSGQDPRT